MNIPWWIRWAVPRHVQEDIRRTERLQQQHWAEHNRTDTNRRLRQRVGDYLDANYTNYLPLIERTFAQRFFVIERDRLLSNRWTRKTELEALAHKTIKRGEVAPLHAFYDQHFPPGSEQANALAFVDAFESLDESLPLTEFLDRVQGMSQHLQQVLRQNSQGKTSSRLTPGLLGDYRRQMKAAYQAVVKQVEKQAFPGASPTVLNDEVLNQWNAWQMQNGVFATITRTSQTPV